MMSLIVYLMDGSYLQLPNVSSVHPDNFWLKIITEAGAGSIHDVPTRNVARVEIKPKGEDKS